MDNKKAGIKRKKEESLARAKKPLDDAIRLHPYYKGKIEIVPKCRIEGFNDFSIWYTPGVAAPCQEIRKNRELVYEYTNKWNTVAVVSDGTRPAMPSSHSEMNLSRKGTHRYLRPRNTVPLRKSRKCLPPSRCLQ